MHVSNFLCFVLSNVEYDSAFDISPLNILILSNYMKLIYCCRFRMLYIDNALFPNILVYIKF